MNCPIELVVNLGDMRIGGIVGLDLRGVEVGIVRRGGSEGEG